jgi:putative transposase
VERPADWVAYVNEPQSEGELAALRRSVNRGCPFGSEEWQAATVTELGLESTMRARGRREKGPVPFSSPSPWRSWV